MQSEKEIQSLVRSIIVTLDLSLSSVFDIVILHGWEKYHCSALFKKKQLQMFELKSLLIFQTQ